MKNKLFRNFYLFSVLAVLFASFYPIYMGISVVSDMIRFGTVYAENYPKYIIPYTPIAVSLIVGVSLLPLLLKYFKKYGERNNVNARNTKFNFLMAITCNSDSYFDLCNVQKSSYL